MNRFTRFAIIYVLFIGMFFAIIIDITVQAFLIGLIDLYSFILYGVSVICAQTIFSIVVYKDLKRIAEIEEGIHD